ncbi:MAG: hypothetical protein EPN25_13210 [Nitrospirae bacterium]|nr:MAG: hypothetical protein EPN25_13210 [Nitrospirota bacterium]
MKNNPVIGNIEALRGKLSDHGLLCDNNICSEFGYDTDLLFDLFISRMAGYAVNTDAEVNSRIEHYLTHPRLDVQVVPLDNIDKWHIDAATGNLAHNSGRFFSITGLMVRHRSSNDEITWDQPIIDQPEVGILGILAAKFSGVLHFCLQAKEEPGNINLVQLAPTVQATYSNYTQAHGGNLPLCIDHFLDPPKDSILFSKLQPEDGGRFLHKSNKNMIIFLGEDDIPALPEEFIWLTLRQINGLLLRDNLINSCARSVLSCLL